MISMIHILREMVAKNATDLYLNVDSPASLRIGDDIISIDPEILSEDRVNDMIAEVIEVKQLSEFEKEKELNTSIYPDGIGRFRVNLFYQRQKVGAVIRLVKSNIPNIDNLGLPKIVNEFSMLKRGLILIIGQTGSGKSTTAAALLNERNKRGNGHIITIEDPVEYVHEPQGCLITQREVGLDTDSYETALKNALRQRPDVVFIGEIRDRAGIEHAMHFAETGHLCISTLHATDCVQALERISNFFPSDIHGQKMASLANTLKVIVGQRLLNNNRGGKTLATEIMMNQGYINSLIQESKFRDIKDLIAKSTDQGMHTFDQSIMDLLRKSTITEQTALAEADNPINMKVSLKLDSPANRRAGQF